MQVIIESSLLEAKRDNYESYCDPYTEGCHDENCIGDGESCYDDCRMGA